MVHQHGNNSIGRITTVASPPQAAPLGGPDTGPGALGGGSLCIPCAITAALHAMFGAPVDTATGDMYHMFSDITIPGRGIPLAFTRTYNSLTPGTVGHSGMAGRIRTTCRSALTAA